MKNKTVIITGAGGNLGTEAVKHFHELGANIVAVYNGTNSTGTKGRILAIENCDLTKPGNAQQVIDKCSAENSHIDIVINIAGGFIWKPVKETSIDDFDAQLNLNFKTMYNMTMAALPKLERRENARIINIGAMGAVTASAGMAAYAASKSAVMRFTEALAAESSDNMTVNAILPSIIDTPANRADMPAADFSKWVTTTELVDLISYLSSDSASGINGALLPASGRV